MPVSGITHSSRRVVPDAPIIGTATNVGANRAFNNGRADVTFSAPTYDGGLPITSYQTISAPTSGTPDTGASSPISDVNLLSATTYTFTAQAINAIGTGPASASTNQITATTVPQAPTIGTASAGNAAATVNWTAGATGGSTITNFTVTSTPAGATNPQTAASSGYLFTGLTNGTPYTFVVRANNTNGQSLPSGSSNSVTPQAPYYNPVYFNPVYFNPYFNPPTYFNPVYFNPVYNNAYYNPVYNNVYYNPVYNNSYYNPVYNNVYFNPPNAYYNPVYNNVKSPSYKCIHGSSKLLTKFGYVFVKDILVGDSILTVDQSNFEFGPVESKIDDSISLSEVTVTKVVASTKSLIRFNKREEIFSDQQPVYVKQNKYVIHKLTSEVKVGDELVLIGSDGIVRYEIVNDIEILGEDTVYEIRTTPHPWFIVGEILVAA